MARKQWYDWFFILMFVFFGFVAWYYEPMFFYGLSGCHWDNLALGLDGPCGQHWVGRAFFGYTQVEPIYANAPVFLRLMNEFDVILFGPFYAVSLYAFITNRHTSGWYRALGTFFCGMVIYAMILYFSWEFLTWEENNANITQVVIWNGPWALGKALLLLRLYLPADVRARAFA